MRIFIFIFLFAVNLTFSAFGQSCVRGVVLDGKNNQPLSGVAIRIYGTTSGYATDSKGEFTICDLKQPEITLELSHVGYKSSIRSNVTASEMLKVYLIESPIAIDPIVVTATLNPQSTWEVPSMVSVIDSIKLRSQSALNTDNYLQTIPDLFINRSNGIFSKNASVTMRGLDGTNRVLILYDGAPLNKTSYGFINWSLISPDLVDQIEVVHGPSSALFGNNAMAGVINIRTKEPINSPLYGSVTGETGSLGLYGARAMIGGKLPITNRGVNLMINGFYRKGDGYIIQQPKDRDSTCVPAYLMEKGLTYKVNIPISDSSSIYAGGNLYQDKRSSGKKVFLSDGSYDSYTTNRIRLGYTGYIGMFKLDIYSYAQKEKYLNQTDNINQTGEYKLSNTYQTSGDIGFWANASRKIGLQNDAIFGIDLKHGWMAAEDIYRTSTDNLIRKGKVTFAAVFLQDEQTLFNSKVKILGGIRFDYAKFYDGLLDVKGPTKNTGFANDTLANFPGNSWSDINPKLGIRYFPNKWLSVYGSVASGFMPAKLDDLCSSRKISKGFKMANPDLKPEHLITYEIGGNVKLKTLLRFDLSLYLSNGYDFQYFVSTGKFLDIGGDVQPIVRRENITSVRVYGGDASVTITPLKSFTISGNFSMNHSEITKYKVDPLKDTITLKGKLLAEVPIRQASIETMFLNRFVNIGLAWIYIGPQWGDEVNSYEIDSWNTFNLRLWKDYRSVRMALDIQDLLDKQFVDKKDLLSPGRFVQLSVKYSFK